MGAGSLEFVVGDATQPRSRPAILVHVCNDIGGWGAGFVLALSKRWPEPEARFREAFRKAVPPLLGETEFVAVEDGLEVANLIGQRGIRQGQGVEPPVRYEAIRTGLRHVAARATATGASVHMPRIGCGLAGGRWEDVEAIVRDELVAHGVAVTVYDLPAR